MSELRNLQATGLSTLGTSLKEAFDLLNLYRLQSGIDNYGMVSGALVQIYLYTSIHISSYRNCLKVCELRNSKCNNSLYCCVLCCAVLCCAVLCCAVLCCVVSCHFVSGQGNFCTGAAMLCWSRSPLNLQYLQCTCIRLVYFIFRVVILSMWNQL